MPQYATSPNAFYRHNFTVVIALIIIAMAFIFVLVTFILYQVLHRPLPSFSATTPSGKTMALRSYDEPNYLPETILKWASKAAVAAYTLNFVNYDKQMAQAKPFFTSQGWANYQNSLQSLLTTVINNKLMVTSVVTNPPVIASQGDDGSGYVWHVQMPFLVTFQSTEEKTQKDFMVLLTVKKIPTHIDVRGMGINEFVMS